MRDFLCLGFDRQLAAIVVVAVVGDLAVRILVAVCIDSKALAGNP